MPESRFTTINQHVFHYVLQGDLSGTALVFINSLGGDLRIWDAVIPELSDQRPIVRYDLRGQGLSDCPPGPYTIEQFSDDLVGLLDFLDLEQAIPIGISVGGMVAQHFAANYPERVPCLVLADTGARIGTAEMWNERIAALRAHGMEHLTEAILTRWFPPEFAEERPEEYRGYANMLARNPVSGYTATCEAIRDADLSALSERIRSPALVLCGAKDIATPPEMALSLAEALPDARLALISGAAHLPCIEQPAAMAGEMDRFLNR